MAILLSKASNKYCCGDNPSGSQIADNIIKEAQSLKIVTKSTSALNGDISRAYKKVQEKIRAAEP